MNIVTAIQKLTDRQNLTENEVRDVINQIMRGEATSCQKGGFLTALKMKGETTEEMLGAVMALRDNFTPVQIDKPVNLIDTCGTGGDGGKTFNISTCVAIIAASGGAKIAKHGNHAISSKSGSADVLAELNIKTDYTPKESVEVIAKQGMAFLFAPQYNPAMKNVVNERRELGCRTLFNLIGPLSNPAPLTGQLLGIYDGTLVKSACKVLKDLGLNRALVVHGDDGLDEITTTTTSTICELNYGEIKEYKFDIEKYGFKRAKPEDIAGGNPKENAQIIMDILKGTKGPKRDIVVINSGAALYAAEIVDSLKEGFKKAEELIDSNKAYEKYRQLIQAI